MAWTEAPLQRSAYPHLSLLKEFESHPLRASGIGLPEDNLWDESFGLPTLDGEVYCATIWNGSLVIGGQFYQVGGTPATNIAMWNGVRWSALGAGADEAVLCLAVYEGDLIAGGAFRRAGDVASPTIARWDGLRWSAIGPGLDTSPFGVPPAVSGLGLYEGDLIALGSFGSSGGVPLWGIGRWDGMSWHSMGNGLNGPGFAMAVLGDSLFVGGDFTTAGGLTVSGLARWSGSGWSSIDSGGVLLAGAPATVTSLITWDDRLVVGGEFDHAGGVPARNIASYFAGTWEPFGVGLSARVTCMAVHEERLCVGIYFGSVGVLFWDGSWQSVAPMQFGYPSALVSTGSVLIVGGSFQANKPDQSLAGFHVARWEHGAWSGGFETWNERMHGLASFSGASPLVQSMAVYKGELVVGGNIHLAGDPPRWVTQGRVTTWDGTRWQSLLPSEYFGQAFSLLAQGDTLVIGGSFAFNQVHLYAHGSLTSMGGLANTVTSLALFEGTLYAGTALGSSNEPQNAGLYRWNGEGWETVGLVASSEGFPGVHSLMIHDGQLIVGGEFESIGGVPAVNISSWNGTHFQSFGPGLQSIWYGVTGLAEWQGDLVAAGSFINLPGGGSAIASWNGTSWQPLGELVGIAYTARNVRGTLFAGGWFGPVRQHLQGLYRFDGTEWTVMGSGVNGPVHAIQELGDNLYFGGSFTLAGGKSSFGVARWTGMHAPPTPPPIPFLSQNRPNPFRDGTQISVDLPQSGHVRITVHDIMGREVQVLTDGLEGPGTFHLSWNGRDRRGSQVPAGVYFIRSSHSGGSISSRKILRLP